MNILLIAPDIESKFARSKRGFKIPYPIMFSTSGLQLLGALTPSRHFIKIVDETLGEKVDYAGEYDLVGISMMTTQSSRGYKIADEFRRRGVQVVGGGYHPSVLPDEALEHFDAITIGEAEYTWGDLLEDAQRKELKRIYHSDKLTDMADIPWPRRDLVRDTRFGVKNFIQTSRGCPQKCSFCSIIKFFGYSYRSRPVDDVIAEIKNLKKTGALKWNMVYFSDDNIAGNPAYAKALFTALIPLKIKWGSQCSIAIARDDELLRLARASGCISLAIGFEAISEQSLKIANKNLGTAAGYKDAIAKIHSYKIAIFGLFIFGFDSDDRTVFDKTFAFIEDNHLEYAMFSVLTPLPGTGFYDEYKKNGRLLHENWADYDFQHVVFTPAQMSAQELQDGRYNTAKRIHSLRSICKRVIGARTNLFFPLTMNLALKRLYFFLPKI